MAEHLPAASPAEDPTLALFAQWAEEAKAMTPEEQAQEQRLWEQFETGINEARAASGMRRLQMPRVIILDTFPLSSTAKLDPPAGTVPTTLDHCRYWIEDCIAAGNRIRRTGH